MFIKPHHKTHHAMFPICDCFCKRIIIISIVRDEDTHLSPNITHTHSFVLFYFPFLFFNTLLKYTNYIHIQITYTNYNYILLIKEKRKTEEENKASEPTTHLLNLQFQYVPGESFSKFQVHCSSFL